MTAALDPRVGRVFARAAPLEGEAREHAVSEGCGGDAALEAEVRSLLAAHDGAGDFLLGTALEPPAVPDIVAGRYRIVQAIGSGSMGTVYQAEQLEPVRRMVALKLLRAGACSAEALSRFEAERRIVARLTHPGITRLFDAGTTPDGRPWFAMELVAGRPITAWCDERSLSFTARVRLAAEVCRAVEHAHANGVIHRDLKPGNVLVCEQDGRPVPRVIDFGVAKASGALDVAPFQTLQGELVGTLEYMSPEQALGAPGSVDARTDVYALGAILYELVAGTPPLPIAAARRDGLEAVLRVLRQAEPERPSARIAARARAERDPARRAALRAAARQARGDFDRIACAAVEKDRARRYASAAEVADDLERFLRHEPVSVSTPTTLYQVAKFARRHRTPVAAAAAVLLALLTGLVLAVGQAREAERQRLLAEERERAAQEAVSDTLVFVTELLGLANTELSNLPGGTRARLALASRGLERVAMLADRAELADRIDTSLGYARQRVGEAETVAGRPVEALAAYEASLVHRERAVERVGGTFERRSLGVGHWRMAEVRLALGETSAAEAHAREALARMQALDAEGALPPPIDHNVYLGMSHQVLAEVVAAEGRGEEALAEFAQALRLMDAGLAEAPAYVPMERIRAQVLIGRGEVLLRAGRPDEALVELERSLAALAEQAGRAGVANAWERTKEAQALLARAAAFAALGRSQDAADDARRAAELAAALADADPDDFESRVLLGRAQSDAGAFLARLGLHDQALETLAEAAALLEGLARRSPRHAPARREQARAAARLGGLAGASDPDPARHQSRARELAAALEADGLLLPVDDDLRALRDTSDDD